MIGLLLGGKMNRGTIWRYKIGKGMLIQGINMYDALRPSKKKMYNALRNTQGK